MRLKLSVELEKWPLVSPFRITGYLWESIEVVVVGLERDGCRGLGEAAGVYYRNDRPGSIARTLESVRTALDGGITRDELQTLLPPGGARNALDCALWDLEAKLSGRPSWQSAGLTEAPRPLLTTFTCGVDTPDLMAAKARSYAGARALKVKLAGEALDAERVRAVRAANPHAWLGIDANQGFTCESLDRLMKVLVEANVKLVEQPFPVGQEGQLAGLRSPIPIAADESVQDLTDIPALVGRFDVVNIKLDKCGGLTEGLAMVRRARELGLKAMVGNMMGTSLAMAPALLLGQLCEVVDLDGPALLQRDRAKAIRYVDGLITLGENRWGRPA